MRNRLIVLSTSIFALGAMVASDASAKIFNNDTFLIAQEATDSFGLFINGSRERTMTGSGSLSATFTDAELQQLLLSNNNLNSAQAAAAIFTVFLPRDLAGLFTLDFSGTNVELIFNRDLVENNESGTASFKYRGPKGSDRNFVRVTGSALAGGGGDDDGGGGDDDEVVNDDGGDDTPIVVIPGGGESGPNSQGGSGPFFNDTFTITQNGDAFLLDINGTSLGGVVDSGGDIKFSIPANTFKSLVLANNGVSGSFLGDGTDFFDFLAKGNAGLIDVTLGDNIAFNIDRDFVLDEESGESSFKYNAGGKKARNFINFVGVADVASPSS